VVEALPEEAGGSRRVDGFATEVDLPQPGEISAIVLKGKEMAVNLDDAILPDGVQELNVLVEEVVWTDAVAAGAGEGRLFRDCAVLSRDGDGLLVTAIAEMPQQARRRIV